MRKIDYAVIVLDIIAAMLTAVGSPWGAPFFVFASIIGLLDGIRHKAISAATVNSIFLALNIYSTIDRIILPLLLG